MGCKTGQHFRISISQFVCGFTSSVFISWFLYKSEKMLFLVWKICDLRYFGLTPCKIQLCCFNLRFWCWDINVEFLTVGLAFSWIWWNLASNIKSLSFSLLYCTVNYSSLQNESSYFIFSFVFLFAVPHMDGQSGSHMVTSVGCSRESTCTRKKPRSFLSGVHIEIYWYSSLGIEKC